MGPLTVDKADHLFWLGRYTERVYTTLTVFHDYADEQVDGNPYAYRELSQRLQLPFQDLEPELFPARFLHDTTEPLSVYSSMSAAFDNAVLLRGELTSENLSYIELSLARLRRSKDLPNGYLAHLRVLDTILAFWGSVEDTLTDIEVDDILHTGKYLERVDLYTRLRRPPADILTAIAKLDRHMADISLEARFGLQPAVEGVIRRAQFDPKVRPEILRTLIETYKARWTDAVIPAWSPDTSQVISNGELSQTMDAMQQTLG